MIEPGGYIRQILALPPGAEATVRGWVKTRTEFPEHYFVKLNDGSCFADLQLLVKKSAVPPEVIEKVSTGACLTASGSIVASLGKEQPIDLEVASLTVHGEADPAVYPLQKKRHTLEMLREIAHLRPRSNTFGAVFRVRNVLSFAIHRFFQERGFLYLHAPIITTSDAEGAGQMFQVTTLPPGQSDLSQDFFGRKAHLTVSGQLEAEIFALAFANVYTFGPTFRAENSNTPRHLAEFWMVEPEMAFCDLAGNMKIAEEFLKYILQAVLAECRPDLEFFRKWYDKDLFDTLEHVADSSFEHVTYTDAVELLAKSGRTWEFPCHWGADLQSEHERYLTDEVFKKPVIVTDYPREIKAFYMRENADGRTVRAMDILAPRIGEIIGGSQREERHDVLLSKIRAHAGHGMNEETYSWYLDLRRFGGAEHSGFGLGLERMLMYLTGMKNIRDVIPFPRTPGHAEY